MRKQKGKGRVNPVAKLNAQRAYKKAIRRRWINTQKVNRANQIPE